jgi:DNA polymerase III epsilon subunit-like protein
MLNLPKFKFAIIDTETTGLEARSDKILELAVVRFEDGEKVVEHESLFSVGGKIPPHVQALTRIKDADLEGKPSFDPEKVISLLEDSVLVGHNVPFDMGMLTAEGVNLEGRAWIDTAMLASVALPECKSWSLPYLSEVLDLPHEPKHRAMGDVIATSALLEKICERLSSIPEDVFKKILNISSKGTDGYAKFFEGIKSSGKKFEFANKKSDSREGIKPSFLNYIESSDKKVWVAVKNLHSTLRMMGKGAEKFSVVHPPQFVLDSASKDEFLSQEEFTVYETTLAIKILLYEPVIQDDLPIHAEERDVWKGKLACTKDSDAYKKQMSESGDLILIDHKQLLELIKNGSGPEEGDQILVDDASMLEDTATKALRWSFSIDPIRAAAEGDDELTSFLDAYQIWIEKVRNFQDIRYFVEADLTHKNAKGLKERLLGFMEKDLTNQVRERLEDLSHILDPKELEGRIAYISQFRDGGQIVQSVPTNISKILKDVVYDKFKTKLIFPPGENYSSVVSEDSEVECIEDKVEIAPIVFTDEHMNLDRLINFVDGKVIALISSKRTIEQLFIKYVEPLEEKGIKLIAQGLSGGTGRMQAEFCASECPTVFMITPWVYEGIELPQGTVDHMWMNTLPFDHPSQAVLSRRGEELYQDSFNEYFVPRLLSRMFRILRSYNDHKKEDANVILLDSRIRTKGYGGRVREYLEKISN